MRSFSVVAWLALSFALACGSAVPKGSRARPWAPGVPSGISGSPSTGAGQAAAPAAALPTGWSIRDDVPYARVGAEVVVDEAADRLLVFGASTSDLWALPLSGDGAMSWKQLVAEGDYPPPRGPSPDQSHLTAYDASSHRMLLARNVGWPEPTSVRLFELSLTGTPIWRELPMVGAAPSTIDRLAVDPKGHRLLASSGEVSTEGELSVKLFALPLDNASGWQVIAAQDPPDHVQLGSPFLFDAKRDRLVFSSYRPAGELLALDLTTFAWSSLAADPWYDASTGVFDTEDDRILVTENGGVRFLPLESGEWSANVAGQTTHSSVVVDHARNRLLRFGGYAVDEGLTNVVSAVPLDSLKPGPPFVNTSVDLVPATRTGVFGAGQHVLVWDPVRRGVVGYRDYSNDVWIHHLDSSSTWVPLSVDGEFPERGFRLGVYDVVNRGVLAFAGSGVVVRLDSDDGRFQVMNVGQGPSPRLRQLTVLDEAHRQIIVYGGVGPTVDSPEAPLDDCWALSMDGAMAWTKLEPTGTSPGARDDLVGAYDPIGQRLVAVGKDSSVYLLELHGSPSWSGLNPVGEPPSAAPFAAAYDAGGHRVLLLSSGADGVTRLTALELDGSTAWHRFCTGPLVPTGFDASLEFTDMTMVEDGVFLNVGGGAFRFDLATPYCD